MVPITIGVPVFNGADLIDECLACLARQSFRDFQVFIHDNASDDATADIVQSWAARDSRFVYFRHPANFGVMPNFLAAVKAADTPWFLWRAHDDLSDDNFLEVLHRLAAGSPGCDLAVSTVVSHDLDGGRRTVAFPPLIANPGSLTGRLRMLLGCHPSWFYGLWRTARIQEIYAELCANYPFPYAADHAALYGPIIDGAVRATTATRFIQRARRTAATPRRQTRMPFSLMMEARRSLRRELRRLRAGRDIPPALGVALALAEPFYLQRTTPTLLKMARTYLRELLGLSGKRGGEGPYFERTNLTGAAFPPSEGADPASRGEAESS